MPDLLVKLYDLPGVAGPRVRLAADGIVVRRAMAHEASPDPVLDPCVPGNVRRDGLAQQVRGHAESEVGRTEALGGSGPGEGLPEGQLARLVGGAQARDQARLGPSITGVRVGVERLDRHAK